MCVVEEPAPIVLLAEMEDVKTLAQPKLTGQRAPPGTSVELVPHSRLNYNRRQWQQVSTRMRTGQNGTSGENDRDEGLLPSNGLPEPERTARLPVFVETSATDFQ